MNVLKLFATTIATTAVLLAPIGMAGSASASPAPNSSQSTSASLPAFPGWASFPAKKVTVKVPFRSRYFVPEKRTTVPSSRKVSVQAKSNGSVVYAKFPTGWKKVPYRYVKSTNTLVYDEALRNRIGVAKDPFGSPKPTYIYMTYADWKNRDSAGGGGTGDGGGGTTVPTGPTEYPTNVTTGSYDPSPGAEGSLGGNWRNEMLSHVNGVRASVGAPPLGLCQTLNNSSQGWANYMASTGYFNHGINGFGPRDRMMQARYGLVFGASGENIASGYPNVPEVMGGWISSPGHYSNLVSGMYTHVGFGASRAADGSIYYVQNFASGGTC